MDGVQRTVALFESWVGRTIDEVETPVALVDLDRMDANIDRLQGYAETRGIALWPHAKTHKCVDIGRRQLARGAQGLTVAKTGEAEVFHEAGVERLLVHYPTFGAAKWQRLAEMAGDGLELTVALDGLEPARGLSDALAAAGADVQVLVEVDLGLRRTGVQPSAAGELGARFDALPGLEVAGVSGYPGVRQPPDELDGYVADVDARLQEARESVVARGLRCDRISAGSTPTRYAAHRTIITEVRAGTYVFLDRVQAPTEPDGGADACALTVLATVVSTSVPGRAIIDAGSKALTSDGHPDGRMGALVGGEGALVAVNEEHGYVDLDGSRQPPRVGDRVRVIPNHACGCVNQQNALLGVRGDVVEGVLPVAARGLTW